MNPIDLTSALIRDPLIVAPDTTVMAAIVLMSGLRSDCSLFSDADDDREVLQLEARSSCVLVVEGDRLLGIFTERDGVRLSVQRQSLENLPINQAMTHPVITLQASACKDLVSVVHLLHQHPIRHLPLLDDQNRIVGLLTHENLRQGANLEPLLRWRQIAEVMTAAVVCAAPHQSMMTIAGLMAAHQVSSVVIVQAPAGSQAALVPVGIVTERDIVQFQALSLSLDTIAAAAVMTPVLAVQPDDSLWTAHQIMTERLISRLVVTTSQGELLGIVTQTSLLKTLTPSALYELTEILAHKVSQLEAEKVKQLENYTTQLEQQVEERTAELLARSTRAQLMAKIAAKIAASLDLPEILATAVQELRSFFRCDRLLIWQFQPDMSGVVIAESVGAGWRASLHDAIDDPCWRGDVVLKYKTGGAIAIDNIHTAGYSTCYIELLAAYQVKANLVVPIRAAGQLWGLVVGHQCAEYRAWQAADLTLLDEMAVQLAIAIQQATAYQQIQTELAERQQAEAKLQESEEWFRAFMEHSPTASWVTDTEGRIEYVSASYRQMLRSPEPLVGQNVFDLYPQNIAQAYIDSTQAVVRTGQGVERVEPGIRPDGSAGEFLVFKFPLPHSSGRPAVGGIAIDITDRKLAEVALRQSEQRYASLAAAAPVGIFRTDATGHCLYVNDRWSQIAGLSPTDALGMGWVNGLHPDDREQIASEWYRAAQANLPFQLEYRFQRPDGSVSWVFGQAVAEHDAAGQITGYVGTITDISDRKRVEDERKQAEMALAERERQLSTLISNLPGFVYRVRNDPNYTPEFLSQGIEALTGYRPDEYLIEPSIALERVIHPDDADWVWECVQAGVRDRRCYEFEYRIITKTGQERWVWEHGQGIYAEDGTVLWLEGFVSDITKQQTTLREYKSAQAALQTQRDFNQLLAEITSRFVDLRPDALDAEIERSLQLISELTQVDNSYVIKFDEAACTMSMTHEWSQPHCPRQIAIAQAIPLAAFPWSISLLRQREVHYVSCVADLPAAVAIDQASWQRFNLTAVLAVPLIQKSVVTGLMGFASFRDAVTWEAETIRLLQVMGQTIANAQERAQDEQQLYENEERLRLALTAANQGLYDLNIQTGEAIVSPQYVTMLGYDPANFQETNVKWIERLHPDDQEVVANTYRAYVKGEIPNYAVEFRQRTQTGDWKWILSLGKIVSWDEAGNPLRMLGTHTDISDRKLAELQLALQNLILERIAKADPLPEILNALVEATEAQLEGGICSILLCDREGNMHYGAAPYLPDAYNQMIEGIAIGERAGSCGTAAFRREPVIVADIATDPLWQDYRSLALAHGLQACWAVPVLASDGSVLATFAVYHREIHHPQARELEVIDRGANIAKIAIEREQARQTLEQLNRELEAKVVERTAALQEREAQLRDLFDNATDLIQSVAPDGRIIFVNQAWKTTLGYEDAELEQLSIFQVIHPDEQEYYQFILQQLFAGRRCESIETRFLTKAGREIILEGNANCLFQDERAIAVRGIFRDVTERKQAEAQLRKRDLHLKAAQRIGKLGSWEFDLQTGQVTWSDEVFRLFGRDLAMGTPTYDELQHYIHPDDWEHFDQTVKTAIAAGQSYDIEYRICRPHDAWIHVTVRGEMVYDAAGQVMQIIGTILDVTDRKQAEATLQQTATQLAATNQELESFSYSVSHDLRAPLRHINGFVAALRKQLAQNHVLNDPKLVHYLQVIETSSQKMGHLIDGLLTLSRIGRRTMAWQPIPLRALVEEVIGMAQNNISDRPNIEFVIGNLPTVTGDATLLKQVFQNLIDNAVKFSRNTPAPRIEINSQPDGTILIKDNGAGFQMEYADKLFGAFQRLHGQTEFEGTGIGLALVQRIVHRHGGSIWAEAQPHQGATFYLKFGDRS